MQFKFTPSLLRTPLALSDSLIEERSPIPSVSHILIDVSPTALTLVATDLRSTVSFTFPTSSDLEITTPGSILVPASPLSKWVSRVDAPVRLSLDGTVLKLRSASSTLTLKTIPASEYPAISFTPSTPLGSLSVAVLVDALKKAAISADPSDALPVRNSICIDNDSVVAADGTRFSRITIPSLTETPTLIPRDSVAPLWRALSGIETVDLSTDGRRLIFTAPNFIYAVQLISESYFDWRAFFKSDPHSLASIPTAELRSAVLRISDTRSEVPWIHMWLTSDTLTLDNRVPGNDAATHGVESIALDAQSSEFEFHINLAYVKDILTVFTSPSIEIGVLPIGNMDMFIARDETSVFVVAPMSLEGG